MGFMRTPTPVYRARGQENRVGGRPRKTREGEYLFTLSPYEAAHYISPENTISDGDYVDPNEHFPRFVMRGVDYAIKRYGHCHVAEQVRAEDGAKMGIIMTLSIGDRVIAVYAVRYES